ncbi:MAG: Ig-like domain-containing protein [Gammaproteobacteria bacterium]
MNVTVAPTPDAPVAVDDGPITFDIGVPIVISVLANDFDADGDTLAVVSGSITGVSAGSAAIAVNSDTQIQYTSSLTQFTNDTFSYGNIDDSSGTLTSGLATVSLTPRDSDGDGVINYLDNCAASPNADQADNDNDSGTYINNNNLADPVQVTDPDGVVTSSPGGDECDDDDDNDGIPDTYEDANLLDSFDATDATTDNDGDGISNIDEFVNGTNPNLFDFIIDATGYFTAVELTPPDPKSVHLFATAVTPIFESLLVDSTNPTGPYRPGINDIRWAPSNSTESRLDLNDSGNLLQTPPVQTLRIRPIVSFAANQQVLEGGTASVQVTLNGVSPSWPGTDATVDYTVSGSASNPADHNALGGTITFADQDFSETILIDTVADGIADANETIVLTFTPGTNSNTAIGVQNSHTITIVEGNVAPQGTLIFDQGGPMLSAAYLNVRNNVDITINATDQNAGQTLSYDWTGTDNALTPPVDLTTANWTTTSPTTAGNYLVTVLVSDDGSPSRSVRISRILKVEATEPLAGAGTDSDGDGIPDYLDAQDGTAGAGNLIPDQTVNMASSHLLESNPGTTLIRGQSATSAGRFGALVTDDDIEQFGGSGGTAPLNGGDSLEHATGVYDFEVHGLVPGATANIVIPLQTGIPKNAVYRKFDPASGWKDFVTDSKNKIYSAVGAQGACPEPGSNLYSSGLNYLDNCIELVIEDGGPNDSDGAVNGAVADPGTTGISLSDPETEEVEDGGGRMSPLLLAVFVLLGIMAIGRRQKKAA